MTNNTSRDVLLKVNEICHAHRINFIAGTPFFLPICFFLFNMLT
jgi:hypothetical protein